MRNAFITQPEKRAALRAGRDLHRDRFFHRPHMNFTAESRLRNGEVLFCIEIVAFAGKMRIFREVNHDEQIPLGTAARAGLSAAGNAKRCSFANARRNTDGHRRCRLNGARSAARRTRILNNASFSAANGTRLRHYKKTTLGANLPRAPARFAGDRSRTWFSARAMARFAALRPS